MRKRRRRASKRLPDRELNDAEKECIYWQAEKGRGLYRIAASFRISLQQTKRVITAKRQGYTPRVYQCLACDTPLVQNDIFCGPECESVWNERLAATYFKHMLVKEEEIIWPVNWRDKR